MGKFETLLIELEKYKKHLSGYEAENDWESIARPEQLMPEGDWFGWLIMAGRGFGKTRTGSQAIKKMAMSGDYKRICLIGETYDQTRSIMVEGESGILNVHSKADGVKYYRSNRQIVWPNGASATCFSGQDFEALRGPQFDCVWVDELAKFENAEKTWDQLMFCLRLGKAPKIIITTTPRPKKIIYDLVKRKDFHLTKGSTLANSKNLSKDFIKMIKEQYQNTKLGKQEIEGDLLSLDDSAIWQYSDFSYVQEDLTPQDFSKMRIIIAADPAITSNKESDETGIIVAGKIDDKYYILEDASGIMKPEFWAKKVEDLFHKYKAEKAFVEVNQGGDVLMTMLKQATNIPWESVRAKESKIARAESISVLYKNKKVKHVHGLQKLEEQMINAHVNFADDRLDAATWALRSLIEMKEEKKDELTFDCWAC